MTNKLAEVTVDQRAFDSCAEVLWDVAVIGAGPAGSMTAIHLAERGHKVVLLDRHRFPRDKACGDTMLWDARMCLKSVGLLDKVEKLGHYWPYATVFSPSRVEFQVRGNFLTLRRYRLDALLAQGAIDAGAVFCRADITDVAGESDGPAVYATGTKRPIRARVAVIATGHQVGLVKRLGLIANAKPQAIAVRGYVRSSCGLDHLVLVYDRRIVPGYMWIIPVGEDLYNVGCGMFYRWGSQVRSILLNAFDILTTDLSIGRELMRQGEMVEPLRGAGLRCALDGAAPMDDGHIVVVGETIGTTYPFTGEGIGKAMESGALAAEVISQVLVTEDYSLLSRYPQLLETRIKPQYQGYLTAQRWLTKPWLNDFMARRMRDSSYLRSRFKSFVADNGDPRRVYAFWTVLQSLWK